MAHEQASIRIENEREFVELSSAIERVFDGKSLPTFLKWLEGKKVPVRDLDRVLQVGALEASDAILKKSKRTAQGIYHALPVSDQAQMREFYLSKIEQVDQATRHRFHKVYQYY